MTHVTRRLTTLTCAVIFAATAGALATTARQASPRANEPGIDRVLRVSLLVRDQDAALRWYTDVLGFEKRADDRSRPGFRWLTVGPSRQPDFELVLLQASPEQMTFVGKQPTSVVATSDCRGAYERLKARGVQFASPPAETGWGVSAVFTDLYGNGYNLLEPR
jgi:catechol 2,3-dioxygenase-like lactoylglutathione lyase family enzyme